MLDKQSMNPMEGRVGQSLDRCLCIPYESEDLGVIFVLFVLQPATSLQNFEIDCISLLKLPSENTTD